MVVPELRVVPLDEINIITVHDPPDSIINPLAGKSVTFLPAMTPAAA
jgi:hypothetical protein